MEYILGMFSFESMVIAFFWSVIVLIANFRIFEKAGETWWKALIPIYNEYILWKISWGTGWLFLLQLIPIVGLIALIVQTHKLSKAFGHGALFTIGLLILPGFFKLYLAFSQDRYSSPGVYTTI